MKKKKVCNKCVEYPEDTHKCPKNKDERCTEGRLLCQR